MSTHTPSTPDRWSLDSWFTGLGAPDYTAFKSDLVKDLADLRAQADALSHQTPEIARVITK